MHYLIFHWQCFYLTDVVSWFFVIVEQLMSCRKVLVGCVSQPLAERSLSGVHGTSPDHVQEVTSPEIAPLMPMKEILKFQIL